VTTITTRERALHAAVELVGGQGIRALTHARVDAQAGLPRGSTSNHFRTRAALIAGLVTWIAESERADFAGDFDPASATPDDLIDVFCALLEVQTGLFAERTRARYALFLESVDQPEVIAPLLEQRSAYEEWTRRMLTAMGAPRPDADFRALMACGEGLMLHRLSVDPDAELRPAVAAVVRGCFAP